MGYMDWLGHQVGGLGRWLFGPPPEERPAAPEAKQYTERMPATVSQPPPQPAPVVRPPPAAPAAPPQIPTFARRPPLAPPKTESAESEPGRYQINAKDTGKRAPGWYRPAPGERQPAFDARGFFERQDSGRFAEGGAAKVEKATAHYQDTPKNGRACQGCSMFEAPHTCSAVKGFISKRGWCSYWAKGRKAGGQVNTPRGKDEIDPSDSEWAQRNPRINEAMENATVEWKMPGGHYMPDELPGGADATTPHYNPYAADERMPQFPGWPWLKENQEAFDRRPRGYAPGGKVSSEELADYMVRQERQRRIMDAATEPRFWEFWGKRNQINQDIRDGLGDERADRYFAKSPRELKGPNDAGGFVPRQKTDGWVPDNIMGVPVREEYRKDGGAVEAAEAQINPNPTEAQKEAGNYAKGHLTWQGLDVTLENAKGSTRSGTGKDGKTWSVKMPAPYGYIKGSEGKDGDHVDVYIGPDQSSKRVFVVDQIDAESGKFDEHKCMLSYRSKAAALADYKAAFSDGKGADRIGSVAVLSIDSFRDWLKRGNTKKPLGRRAYADGGAIQHSLDRLGSRLPTRDDSGGRR